LIDVTAFKKAKDVLAAYKNTFFTEKQIYLRLKKEKSDVGTSDDSDFDLIFVFKYHFVARPSATQLVTGNGQHPETI
jgi:hypothetical protein